MFICELADSDRWQLKTTCKAIQHYRNSSGLSWDTPESENDPGRGANITTPEEVAVWNATIAVKANNPIRPYRNRGWPYLKIMEDIIPVAGASGRHSFAPGLNHSDIVDSASEELDDDRMAVDNSTHSSTVSSGSIVASVTPNASTTVSVTTTMHPKRRRTDEDATSIPSPPLSASALSSDRQTKASQSKEKVSAPRSSRHSASTSATSLTTSQRVEKLSSAAAIVQLNNSVGAFTAAIQEASKSPETAEEKAARRREECPELVRSFHIAVAMKSRLLGHCYLSFH
ncbi:hypothetical protein H0H92_008192 [Tricholoma furcatifolium]|nr:hypothetical protein H0H92_008192 [Tricholoma furcatifolium]